MVDGATLKGSMGLDAWIDNEDSCDGSALATATGSVERAEKLDNTSCGCRSAIGFVTCAESGENCCLLVPGARGTVDLVDVVEDAERTTRGKSLGSVERDTKGDICNNVGL